MSVKVNYKGVEIASANTDTTKTLKTAGKYCEDDIQIVNTQDGGGSQVASQNDVNFIDYDGTIVYSYTADEFSALSALPANPTHTGLTSQGWNWSLVDAQDYVAEYGKLWIGQMYITDDGKTRIYIHLEEGRISPMLGCCPNGTVDVDWGDGTTHDTLTGTSTVTVKWTPTHVYATPGDYVIKLTVTGSMGFAYIATYSAILRYSNDGDKRNGCYNNAIHRVEIGNGVTSIGGYAFYNCYSLSNITIPNNVTSIGYNAFNSCTSLSSATIPNSVTSIDSAFGSCFSLLNITIPNGVTNIGNNAFNGCYSLSSVTIPNSVTNIGNYAFNNCYSMSYATISDRVTSIGFSTFGSCRCCSTVTIPNSVTSIDNNAFLNCYSITSITIGSGVTSIGLNAFNGLQSVAKFRFTSQTPPTVSNINAFDGIPTDCVIHVPSGTLNAYKTATNYPDPSVYTYVEDIA